MEKQRIGWIGTGVMGRSMCGHLMASGCEAEFGLVQDGLDWEEAGERAYDRLQLAARVGHGH